MNPDWRKIQRGNFTSREHLCAYLQLNPSDSQKVITKPSFVLNIPKRLVDKMEKGTIEDPIFRQFVPLSEERDTKNPLFVTDPVADDTFKKTPKCLQKYAQRALLLVSSACAMHCRYCFRQNFDYAPLSQGFEEELIYLRQDTSLREVILSGGDPLSLNQEVLEPLLGALDQIPHLQRLRFHTRFPIGIPERIDNPFLKSLANLHLQVWFIIHCNHPKELDEEVWAALKKVQLLGIPILNQTVLLKGVNDSVETLQALFETLVDHGIKPYYLHQLDKVQGAAHFEVEQSEGEKLMAQLAENLSGYALPTYVREIPGCRSKTPLHFTDRFNS